MLACCAIYSPVRCAFPYTETKRRFTSNGAFLKIPSKKKKKSPLIDKAQPTRSKKIKPPHSPPGGNPPPPYSPQKKPPNKKKKHPPKKPTIANALGNNINGQPVNYKVYMAKDVNAFAMANGCIRVYSGLMDMMTDNEVEAVIGHEMGHVALGHVKKGMQVALGTNAVRVAAASAGGIVGSLSQSQLGDLGEKLVNSQFSQRQEAEADDYSYDLLRQRGINPAGLATSFEKLAKLEEGRQSSMFDDHPASAERAQHIRDRMSADGVK